jgi:dihydrofolate reductase
MADIVSTLFISLDGVAEIAEDWHFPYFDENMGRAVNEDYAPADVLLLGRVTYDSFAGAWPDREAAGEDDAPFAKSLGDRRKIVVSRKPLESTWRNTELLDGELVEAVTALKANPDVGSVLIPGSISVVQQLLAAGLIDELRLLVHPVAARNGRRLFDDGDTRYHLSLLKSETLPTGVVRLLYAPAAAPGTTTYDDIKDMGPGTSTDG